MQKHVFVTGASGFLGTNLIAELLKQGHQVSAWKHRENSSLLPQSDHLNVHFGDLSNSNPESIVKIEQAMKGCDTIVHCAAKTSEGTSTKEHSKSVNVEGMLNIIQCAKKAGINKIIYISSQSAKISNPGNYGASKKKGEELLMDSGIEYVILRPALIYGPGNAGIFKKFALLVQKLPIIPLPTTHITFQPIYVGDVVQAILNSIEQKDAVGQIADVAGLDKVKFSEFILKVAEVSNLKRLLIPVPMGLALLGARFLALILKRPPVTVDNLIGLTETTSIDLKILSETLGVHPTPLKDGLRLALGENHK